MESRKSAFTLIELLIVVAIIAILAAIAVPNFLEAQTGAKISRVASDQRAIATALESYNVDNNDYPIDGSYSYGTTFRYALRTSTTNLNTTGRFLTTPIAYIVDIPYDPFNSRVVMGGFNPYPKGEDMSVFYASKKHNLNSPYSGHPWTPSWQPYFYSSFRNAEWFLWSVGPTFDYGRGADGPGNQSWNMVYDPTNGTVSFGGIWRLPSATK